MSTRTLTLAATVAVLSLGDPRARAQDAEPAPTVPTPRDSARAASETAASAFREEALLARWLKDGREVAYWRTEVGAARFDVVTATMIPNPVLRVYTLINVGGTPPDGAQNVGGAVTFPDLPIFGQLAARETAATRLVRVAEMAVAMRLWERLGEIRLANVERAFADARVENLERSMRELEDLRRIVEARSSAGLAPEYDVLRVATLSATLEANTEKARIEREQAETKVLSLIAAPSVVEAPLRREGLLALQGPGTLRALVATALRRRPDLLLARRSVRAFEAEAERHRVDAIPAPSVSLGTYLTFNDAGVNITAGLSLPIPVFDRNQGLVGRAEVEADGQRALVEALEARVGAEVRGALRARDRARAAIERFHASGVLATVDLLERAKRAYHGGTFSVAELLDAYHAVWDARTELLELERALAVAEAALIRAVAFAAPAGER
jgi:cobalt-zinc-cadmium efflux system outer membrane protein